jgi:hypothetical protein
MYQHVMQQGQASTKQSTRTGKYQRLQGQASTKQTTRARKYQMQHDRQYQTAKKDKKVPENAGTNRQQGQKSTEGSKDGQVPDR